MARPVRAYTTVNLAEEGASRTRRRQRGAALVIGIAAEVAAKASVIPMWAYRSVSPFSHVSPAYSPTLVDYLVVTLIAAGLIAVGTAAAFSRRDLAT